MSQDPHHLLPPSTLRLIALQIAGAQLGLLAQIKDARDHLNGKSPIGFRFEWAVPRIAEGLEPLTDVWVNRKDPSVFSRDEPQDPENFSLYGRTALVQAIAGPELTTFLP